MGGGEHSHVEGGDWRAKVWSMPGGPNCRPKHWRRNTALALFGVFLVCVPVAMKSAQLEYFRAYRDGLYYFAASKGGDVVVVLYTYLQRPHEPVRPIPSQLWCKNFGKKDY